MDALPHSGPAVLDLFGAAAQVLRQGLAVVLGQDTGRAPVDELVQVGRVSSDGERRHPQVRAILRNQPEDPPANRVHRRVVVSRLSSHMVGYYLLPVAGTTGHFDLGTANVGITP